jgi:hypothetical protein
MIPEFFYKTNDKYKSARYDKWYLDEILKNGNTSIVRYVNSRTKGKKIYTIKDNEDFFLKHEGYLFPSAVEFFVYTEAHTGMYKSKQYKRELKDIQKKYLEFFI